MLIKMMNRLKKEEKGFTLIELLAVIVILAVIAAIAVPYILGVINKSKEDSDVATFVQVYQASRLYVTSELDSDPASNTIQVISNGVAGNPKGLQVEKYLETPLILPSTKETVSAGTVVYNAGAISYIELTVPSGKYRVSGTEILAGKGQKVKQP